jgi:hypothetical protein
MILAVLDRRTENWNLKKLLGYYGSSSAPSSVFAQSASSEAGSGI